MATVDVIKCCLDSIRQISDDIKDAIIYLDAGSTESFQFIGAFPLFIELGARAVCSLENMSILDGVVDWNTTFDPVRRIVVITSCLLSDAHRYILRCLSKLQTVRHCVILTSISEVAHSAYPDSPLGPDAFREYESLLLQDYEEHAKKCSTKSREPCSSEFTESIVPEEEGWSQLSSIDDDVSALDETSIARASYKDDSIGHSEDAGQKLIVFVRHFPLILCPFSPRVFVLPSEGSIAEACLSTEHENSISFGLPPLSTGTPTDADDISPGATLTAQFIYHLALKMDLKLEIFSLGDFSKTVGKLLTDMSSLYDVGRRKRSAGLLLIDRTLDLLTPCCHGDSLVDRIFSSLPRRQRTTSINHVRASKSQLKKGPVKVERAPLDVQIPLENIIREEESKNSNFQLLESIQAFLHGWNTTDLDTKVVELVKLSDRLKDENSLRHSESDILRGSFVSAEKFDRTPYLEAILERRTKDGAILIKKWLQESLRREKISPDMKIRPGFPSNSELQALVKPLAKRQSSLVRNKGIIQLAAATIHALNELHSASWDAFSSAEKILHVNAGDTSQSLAAQISDLVNKSSFVGPQAQKHNKTEASQGLVTLQDALLLTIIGYILAGENFPTSGSGGPFSWQEEHFMKEAIVDAVLENPAMAKLKFLQGLLEELESNLNKMKSDEKKEGPSNQLDDADFDDDQWDSWGDEDADKDTNKERVFSDVQVKLELRDRVDNLFKFLHKLSSSKGNTPLREGISFNYDTYSSKTLLSKLLTRVLGKHDMPGLEYHSSTVGRLFKSGFGRFGIGQAKPSLADQNVILVFVIGGINGLEVREAQEALIESGRPDIELIVGGTTFLTPNDMRELLLGDSSCI